MASVGTVNENTGLELWAQWRELLDLGHLEALTGMVGGSSATANFTSHYASISLLQHGAVIVYNTKHQF